MCLTLNTMSPPPPPMFQNAPPPLSIRSHLSGSWVTYDANVVVHQGCNMHDTSGHCLSKIDNSQSIALLSGTFLPLWVFFSSCQGWTIYWMKFCRISWTRWGHFCFVFLFSGAFYFLKGKKWVAKVAKHSLMSKHLSLTRESNWICTSQGRQNGHGIYLKQKTSVRGSGE